MKLKLILKAFKLLGFSFIPITSSKVSYGLPVIDNKVSPGLKRPKKVVVKAWVPEINWLRTREASLSKT